MIKDPQECIKDGKMMSLEAEEKLAFTNNHVEKMLHNWIDRARKKVVERKIDKYVSPKSENKNKENIGFSQRVEKIISNILF